MILGKLAIGFHPTIEYPDGNNKKLSPGMRIKYNNMKGRLWSLNVGTSHGHGYSQPIYKVFFVNYNAEIKILKHGDSFEIL